jgi:N-methylhydantoinase B
MKSLNHGDSKILPAEVIEATDPILIEEETLAPDSGGAGKFRGGLGTTRTFRVLQDGIGAFSMHRATCPPWGLFGGEPGRPDMFHFEIPGRAPFSEPKLENVPLPTGSIVRMETAGGGGWGSALERDPALVALDVRRGYVSAAAAREQYGVILTAAGEPDAAATAALRAQRR